MSTNNIDNIKPRNTLQTFSYSTGFGLNNLTSGAVITLLLLYYTGVTGISPWWYALAQTIYAIYNAINDPLVGFLTDKNRPKMLKMGGKRFPWILIGILGMALTMQLIYTVPHAMYNNDLAIFFWLLISLCLFDTFYSLFYVNHNALGPILFRTDDSLRKLGVINTLMITIMMIVGMILPIALADKSDPSSFNSFVLIMGVLTIIVGGLVLPGVKENETITKVLVDAADASEDQNFIKYLLTAVKQKNYMLLILVFLFFQVFTNTAVGSLPFFVINVLGFESEDPMMQILLVEFALIFLSIPVWNWIIKKRSFNWSFVTSTLVMAIASLTLLFAQDLTQTTIIFAFLGFAVGGFMSLQAPLINNVMDEMTVTLGERKEGVFFGIQKFFERFSLVVGGFIVAVVRSVTHFDPQDPATFTQSALFGIRVEMIGVGALLLIIAILIFKKYFDLTPAKMETVREQLALIDGGSAD
jgi:GPH family glycoside/pentoside/hexuronide:cation symporter